MLNNLFIIVLKKKTLKIYFVILQKCIKICYVTKLKHAFFMTLLFLKRFQYIKYYFCFVLIFQNIISL